MEGMYRTDITSGRNVHERMLQVRGMYMDNITSERYVHGRTLHVIGMYRGQTLQVREMYRGTMMILSIVCVLFLEQAKICDMCTRI